LASDVAISEFVDTTAEGGATYNYVVTAVDFIGQESECSNEASATPSAEPAMHVQDIAMDLVSAGKNSKGEATILVCNSNDAAVSGATVIGDWLFNGASLATGVSGVTDSNGNAIITSSPTKAKSGDTFTFVVTDIAKDGYIYDPPANVETEDSITVHSIRVRPLFFFRCQATQTASRQFARSDSLE
jgi:hypothetical protein